MTKPANIRELNLLAAGDGMILFNTDVILLGYSLRDQGGAGVGFTVEFHAGTSLDGDLVATDNIQSDTFSLPPTVGPVWLGPGGIYCQYGLYVAAIFGTFDGTVYYRSANDA